MPDATTTEMTASATGVIDADPSTVFEFLRRPENHSRLSGDGSVRGSRNEGKVLGPGDRFGMSMKLGLPYVVASKVVEFEQDRLIAWAHFGKHRWRWQLEPTDDGRTRVTETFDMSTAIAPWLLRIAMNLPEGHEQNVRRSVENLQTVFAEE